LLRRSTESPEERGLSAAPLVMVSAATGFDIIIFICRSPSALTEGTDLLEETWWHEASFDGRAFLDLCA